MKDTIWKLETNIDDAGGESLGFLMEILFCLGARDVNYMPCFMKKNRPGWQLNVICAEEDIPKMEDAIFRHTTTIGIRRMQMERTVLERTFETAETPYGPVRVKVCRGEGLLKVYPEYEDLAAICRKNGESYTEMYQMALASYKSVKK